ncbi:MAG: hypothetical protein AB7P52_14615 [Alphaproteobacteria bacterium]
MLAALAAVAPALAQGDSEYGAVEGGEEEAGASATGPFFYKMDALLAPVIEKRRVRGYAEIIVTLELATREAERLVHDKTLVLRDEFLRDLQFQAGMRGEGDPAIDLRRIKARFRALAARVVGDGVVADVLIDSAIYHGS